MNYKTTNMKTILLFCLLAALLAALLLSACGDKDHVDDQSNDVSSFNSDVLDKWITMELRLLRNTPGVPNHPFARHIAYAGIAALESVAPGLPANKVWSKKWQGLIGLPSPEHGKRYYYPANVNAAMAYILKAFFPKVSNDDKAAIDSLEAVLRQEFLTTQNSSLIESSAKFGRDVAVAVFNWSETDGYKNASAPYIPPAGDGLWVPTPPAFAAPVTPFWGDIRTLLNGSTNNTLPPAPVQYSTDPASPFFQMVKQVFDVSQNLTGEQRSIALFWRGTPGVSTPGHWLSILQQVMRQKGCRLNKAVFAFALTGTVANDAIISCFNSKYHYNLVRPVTYIRNTMGNTAWLPLLPTPAHPEYPAAHAVFSAAEAELLEYLFGPLGSFTDHTYDYAGITPRTFSSYTAMVEEAGASRIYGGIHYRPSIEAGNILGRKVALNIIAIASGCE